MKSCSLLLEVAARVAWWSGMWSRAYTEGMAGPGRVGARMAELELLSPGDTRTITVLAATTTVRIAERAGWPERPGLFIKSHNRSPAELGDIAAYRGERRVRGASWARHR